MLVCNTSQRARRAAIAADIIETAGAADATDFANFDMAIAEAATAASTVDGSFLFTGDLAEAASATDAPNATITAGLVPTTWNPSDKSAALTLSNGNLTAAGSASANNQGVRAVVGKNTGKYYFEGTFVTGSSVVTLFGLQPLAQSFTTSTGTTGRAILNFNGQAFINGTNTGLSFAPTANGTVIGIAVDFTNDRIWFRKAPSGQWNTSGTADPATNTGGLDISAITGVALYPVFSPANLTADTGTANFGASAFSGAVPSGFTAGWG